MKLIKGNWNKLGGTVIVYSRFKGDIGELSSLGKIPPEFSISAKLPSGLILGEYSTSDWTTYVEKAGLSREEADSKLKEFKDGKKEAYGKLLDSMGPDASAIPIFYRSLIANSEKVFMNGLEDILFIGDFSTSGTCSASLKLASAYYFLRFYEGLDSELKDEFKISNESKKTLTYGEISKENIEKYIMDKFVVPMLDSLKYDERGRFNSIRSNFIQFSKDSEVSVDAMNLCSLIVRNRENLPLISTYVNKMVAVANEDFELAAKLRDEIKKLEN